MESKSKKYLPAALDSLESLALLSTVVPTTVHVAIDSIPAPATRPRTHVVRLNGQLSGQSSSPITIDTGPQNVLNGSGRLGNLGDFQVTGNLQRSGYFLLKNRPVNGSLLLSNSKGTITISLHSDDQHNGPSGLPNKIGYTVSGGTGVYAGVSDHGTAHVNFTIPVDIGSPRGFQLTLTSAKAK
jgi:hypothetical protein